MREGRFSAMFVWFSGLFVTCLLLSNIIAGKLFTVGNLVLPCGAVLFPLTYIFGDVLAEVWGYKKSRLIIWVGFAANALMALVFMVVIALPHPNFWQGQDAYALVLGTTPRLVVASLIGYWCGSFSNAAVLSRMKVLTSGRYLFLRTIGSTIVGEGIDTAIFITLAFVGTMPSPVLIQMVIVQYIWKVLYEAIATPATYAVVGWVKRTEGVDTYDHGVSYNPFSTEV